MIERPGDDIDKLLARMTMLNEAMKEAGVVNKIRREMCLRSVNVIFGFSIEELVGMAKAHQEWQRVPANEA